MEKATILNLSEIEELMEEYEGKPCHSFVHSTLMTEGFFWFYKKDTAMLYVPMDNGRYDMHIYNRARGDKALRNWCIRTGEEMWNQGAQVFLNFVKKDRRDLRMFMATLGGKRMCEVGDEVMYSFSREDKDRVIGRIN